MANFEKNNKIDYDAIEVIGGGMRIPKINKIFSSVFKKKVGTHINGNHGIAFGASFLAAKFTKGVKTQKLIIDDYPLYKVKIEVSFIDENELYKSSDLFNKDAYGSKRAISISNNQRDLKVKLVEEPGDYWIEYEVVGVASNYQKYENVIETTTILYFELDLFGIPYLRQAI